MNPQNKSQTPQGHSQVERMTDYPEETSVDENGGTLDKALRLASARKRKNREQNQDNTGPVESSPGNLQSSQRRAILMRLIPSEEAEEQQCQTDAYTTAGVDFVDPVLWD